MNSSMMSFEEQTTMMLIWKKLQSINEPNAAHKKSNLHRPNLGEEAQDGVRADRGSPLAKRVRRGKWVRREPLRVLAVGDDFIDEGVPASKPRLKDHKGCDTAKRETDTGKLQPLPEVPGKGKEKVGEEQAAQVLYTFRLLRKEPRLEQYYLSETYSHPSEPAGHEESSSFMLNLDYME
ncbi:hypothetical protein Tco_0831378 [Tanacetum coccineum]